MSDGDTEILLVEDDPAAARLAIELLRAGAPEVTVRHVGTLAAAEAALRLGEPACVLLDLSLPDSRGVGSVSRLLAGRPDLTIVVMTGRDDDESARAALRLGAQDYVVKSRDLASTLARSVSHARERTRHRLALAAAAAAVQAAERGRDEEVALRRERARIGADLHDVVIQRLYATGLSLTSALLAPEDDPTVRIKAAVEGIDEAIVELRAAIHSLHHDLRPGELAQAVDRVLLGCVRPLGFAPTVTVSGSLSAVAPATGGELLAVLTEALSNAARHAAARRVEVTIVVGAGLVELTVADDGIGLRAPDRCSGLANMRRRAEALGGSFGWVPNGTAGTVVAWRVPARG